MRFPNLSLFPFFKAKEKDDSDFTYASFTARTFALTIDMLLLFVVFSPVFSWVSQIILPNFYSVGGDSYVHGLIAQFAAERISSETMFLKMEQMGLYEKLGLDYVLQFFVSGIFIIFSWVKFNTTPGLFAFRMSVVDADTGLEPSTKQYVIRYIVGIISIMPLMLGMMWMFFNARKMSLHDVAANTVIVRRKFRFGKKEVQDDEEKESPQEPPLGE